LEGFWVAYRWLTKVLVGQWCASVDAALDDALRWGQAIQSAGMDGIIVLRSFAKMEERADPDRAG
jgi:hypothetical protein